MSRLMTVVLLTVLTIPLAAESQPSGNAALRYWQAFALLQDIPATSADAHELEGILKGELPWDEAKFGRWVDQNAEALSTLERGTKLPRCDWGLDLDLGPAAPVAHIAKARALARLDALAAVRLAAQGKQKEAVDAWLIGFRFAQHLSQDGTLVGTLVASTAASAQMSTISQALQSESWDPANLASLEKALQQVPRYFFDWSRPMQTEQQAMAVFIQQAASPTEPLRQEVSEADLAELRSNGPQLQSEFDNIYTEAVAAFRLPANQSSSRLQSIEASLSHDIPFVQKSVPNLITINNTRAQLEADRQSLLAKITQTKQRRMNQ
ncbi:MAG TPA: hypothetical protein VJQ82_25050 [Terriglobales bacterium]|nr:hypothetical protein [Terriglobales bacterium]